MKSRAELLMLAETLIEYPTGCHTNKYYRDKLVVNRPISFFLPHKVAVYLLVIPFSFQKQVLNKWISLFNFQINAGLGPMGGRSLCPVQNGKYILTYFYLT